MKERKKEKMGEKGEGGQEGRVIGSPSIPRIF